MIDMGRNQMASLMYVFVCGILIVLFLWYTQSIRILQEELLRLETSTFVLV